MDLCSKASHGLWESRVFFVLYILLCIGNTVEVKVVVQWNQGTSCNQCPEVSKGTQACILTYLWILCNRGIELYTLQLQLCKELGHNTSVTHLCLMLVVIKYFSVWNASTFLCSCAVRQFTINHQYHHYPVRLLSHPFAAYLPPVFPKINGQVGIALTCKVLLLLVISQDLCSRLVDHMLLIQLTTCPARPSLLLLKVVLKLKCFLP